MKKIVNPAFRYLVAIALALMPYALKAAPTSLELASPGSNDESITAAISGSGEFVAFSSLGNTLIPPFIDNSAVIHALVDENMSHDVFVFNRTTQKIECVSRTFPNNTSEVNGSDVGDFSQGGSGKANSTNPSLSTDGRYVVFESTADNLVADDTNFGGDANESEPGSDIFVFDSSNFTIKRVSTKANGDEVNSPYAKNPTISGDGNLVAFQSQSPNFGPAASGANNYIYVKNVTTGAIDLIPVPVDPVVPPANSPGDVSMENPSISADGKFVSFDFDVSKSNENGVEYQYRDVYRYDVTAKTIQRVTVAGANGLTADGNKHFTSAHASISDDGSRLVYVKNTNSTNPVVFVHDFGTGAATMVQDNAVQAIISGNGRFAAYKDQLQTYIFRKNLTTNATLLVSSTPSGTPPNDDSNFSSMSSTGQFLAFQSSASNLINPDNNGNTTDIFIAGTNPEPPTITSALTVSGQKGAAFSYQITATNNPTSYGATGLPAGLSVDTGTGVISGTPTAVGTSNVAITATNGGGSDTKTLILTVQDGAPTITSTLTAGGQKGAAFTYQITATNNPTSYGATGLPAGLSVDTGTGVISGTPTAVGTSNVAITAMNGAGSDTRTLVLTILDQSPAITSALTASGQVGTAFTYQITATNSPSSYGATGLPTGLSVDTGTGIISGIPTASGAFNVAITAMNAGGSDTQTLVATIVGPNLPVSQLAGKYYGVLMATDGDPAHNGLVQINVTVTGKATGKVLIGGQSIRFKGTVDPATGMLRFGKLSAPSMDLLGFGSLDLSLVLTNADGLITGGLSVSGTPVGQLKQGDRAAYSKFSPVGSTLLGSSGKGKYTVVIRHLANGGRPAAEFPQGDGWATAKIARKSGKVTFAGKLADGSTFSYGGFLSKNNQVSVYAPLYKGKRGFLSGVITFDPTQADTDALASGMIWNKPPNPRDKQYPSGWPTGINVDLEASIFNPFPPVFGANLTSVTVNVTDGGTTGYSEMGTLTPQNQLSFTTANPQRISAKIAAGSGKLVGKFIHDQSFKNVKFGGVVLQKTNTASGYFLYYSGAPGAGLSGAVSIVPTTTP